MPALIDINAVEAEARKEIADEAAKVAKKKIRTKLADIDKAEKVLATLRLEYKALLEDIGAGLTDDEG